MAAVMAVMRAAGSARTTGASGVKGPHGHSNAEHSCR